MVVLQLFGGESGLFGSVVELVAVAGALVLVLMVVALAGVAYRGLVGDGIEWPDEQDGPEGSDDEVRRGSDEDDWKYY